MKTINECDQREVDATSSAISIIVPVYNTELYIDNCLNSIREQSFQDIEVILIDDGSTDSSGTICDKFVEDDNRFAVFHKKNEGLAAARNDGIKYSHSKYIMFVDSDDWVEKDFCKKPYHIAEKTDSDLVVFKYSQFIKEKRIPSPSFPNEGIISKEDALVSEWKYTRAYAWNKLYKKELFDEIEYPVGHVYEDDAITHRIVYHAEKIYYLDECLYNYRILRKGSITSSRSYKMMEDYFYSNFKRIDDLKKWGYDYNNEEVKLSVSYLATFGQKAQLSKRCITSLGQRKTPIRYRDSWKRNLMYQVYRVSPILFDIISVALGKRLK